MSLDATEDLEQLTVGQLKELLQNQRVDPARIPTADGRLRPVKADLLRAAKSIQAGERSEKSSVHFIDDASTASAQTTSTRKSPARRASVVARRREETRARYNRMLKAQLLMYLEDNNVKPEPNALKRDLVDAAVQLDLSKSENSDAAVIDSSPSGESAPDERMAPIPYQNERTTVKKAVKSPVIAPAVAPAMPPAIETAMPKAIPTDDQPANNYQNIYSILALIAGIIFSSVAFLLMLRLLR